jgi:hypothetical protein
MDWLLDYFNLSSRPITVAVYPQPISLGWQLALYGALVVGILANGLLAAARAGRRYHFQWARFLVCAVIGLVVFPAVYEGAQANLGQPTLVQLAAVFASGLGYESLFAGVAGLAGVKDKKK